MARVLDVGLAPHAGACAEARSRLQRLNTRVDEEVVEDLKLLASELVANALRHARLHPGDEVRLTAELDPNRILVRVTDPGPGFRPGPGTPVPRPSGGGWGLVLLDQIADRWGVDQVPDGTSVWFEVRDPVRVPAGGVGFGGPAGGVPDARAEEVDRDGRPEVRRGEGTGQGGGR